MSKMTARYSKKDIREAMRVLGAIGGSAKSEKKAEAARANARKPRPGARRKAR